MLVDFFTKPLQGALFTRMRDKILNLPCSTSPAVHRSVLDLQDFSKGIKKDTKNTTDGQEIIESTAAQKSKDTAENTPAQTSKETQRDAKS